MLLFSMIQIAQAPYFHYWRDGIEHEVWFEDARSIQAKFKLLKELQLRGISYWHSGFDSHKIGIY